MSNYPASENLEKFLVSNNIQPTPRRVQVLKIILTTSSVVKTINLLQNTGLIKEVISKGDIARLKPRKGRPKTKYIYHQRHQDVR